MEDADLSEVDYESWSDLEWAAWFRDEITPTGWEPDVYFSEKTGEFDESFYEAVEELDRARGGRADLVDWMMFFVGGSRSLRPWDLAFAGLPLDLKMNFIEGWYRRQTGVVDPTAGEIGTPPEAEPEAANSSDEVIDLLTDEEEPELWSGSSEGPGINISLPGGVVTVPVETGRRNIRRPIIIGFGVVSVVLAGFVLFRGGDSEEAASVDVGAAADSDQRVANQGGESEPEPASSASLNVSFVDEQGDFVEREPFDPDPNPDPAGDITLVSVRTEGDATIITLEFAAAGENHPGLGLDARITPSDGSIINMLRRPDGSAKVSDPPSGETLTAQWLDADTLELTLGNWTPNGDFELAVSTLISRQGLYTIDEWVGQLTP